MRRSFRRSTVETELVASRPQAPERLVDGIVGRISPQVPVRSARARLGVAAVLTTAMLVIVGATGGFAAAAQALHLNSKSPQSPPTQPACSQYAMAPVITKVSPTKGRVGKRVRIRGLNFLGTKARHHKRVLFPVTSVTFSGGVAATFTVKSNKTIRTTVPAGASSGPITVTNCAGSASSSPFTVK